VPTRIRILLAGPRRTWLKVLLVVVGVPLVVLLFVTAYFWVSYGRLIDAKLKTEQQPIPRIFGRPFEIRAGRRSRPRSWSSG
jgi:hypothetical protein